MSEVVQEKKVYEQAPKGRYQATIVEVQVKENVLTPFKDERTGDPVYQNSVWIRFALDGKKTSDGERDLTVMKFLNCKKGVKFLKGNGDPCVTNFAKFFEDLFDVELGMGVNFTDFDFEMLKGVGATVKVTHKKSAAGEQKAHVEYAEPPESEERKEFNQDRAPLVIKKPFLPR